MSIADQIANAAPKKKALRKAEGLTVDQVGMAHNNDVGTYVTWITFTNGSALYTMHTDKGFADIKFIEKLEGEV